MYHLCKSSLRVLFFLLFTFSRAPAQTVYMEQGFEDGPAENLPYTAEPSPYGSGTVPTWHRVESMYHIPEPAEGNYFWAARDVDNDVSGQPTARLRFDAGNICHLTSARFVFAYQVVGYDGGDDFGYELFLDGFSERREILVDGTNGGGVSTDGWVYHTVAIPGTAQTASLELFFDQNGDDVAAVDHVRLIATGNDGSCQPVCGIRPGKPRVECLSFTDEPDVLRVSIPYAGAELGATVYAGDGTVSGDDPAAVPDGTIVVDGFAEGGVEVVSIIGGDCEIVLPLEIPLDQCRPSDLVINEVLADPGHDANGDGVINAGDEFVEIYNAGATDFDLSGYTLHDGSNSGARFTFPAHTRLGSEETFVVFAAPADPAALPEGCAYGTASGFLGLNNDSPEAVILQDPEGRVVAQVRFDDAPDGESLTLHPDGNLSGGYQPHSSVAGRVASACYDQRNLPVTLHSFTATALGDAVRLDWRTTYEQDNDYFAVERSKQGEAFTELTRVTAAANGVYHFVDYRPFPGQNYYRLRQVDFDGREALYGPLSVRLDSGQIRLFPNPTDGKLRIAGDIDDDQRYEVYFANGLPALTGAGRRVDVERLPAGLYYLRLPLRSDVASLRFMKE